MGFTMPNFSANTFAALQQGIQTRKKRSEVGSYDSYQMNDGDRNDVSDIGGLKLFTYETIGNPDPEKRNYNILQDTVMAAATLNRDPKDVPQFLEECSEGAAKAQRAKRTPGGSTANVVYISADPDRTITVANTGDSRTVLLVRNIETGQVETVRLSKDHEPGDPDERKRIEKAGGFVLNVNGVDRVCGRLAVARSFGDNNIPGITHKPDITTTTCGKAIDDPRYEVYVLNSCDGLYAHGKLHEQDLAKVMENRLGVGPSNGKEAYLAKIFADTAIQAGSTDNITVNFVKLHPDQRKDIIFGTFDGHDRGGEQTAELLKEEFEKFAQENAPTHDTQQRPAHACPNYGILTQETPVGDPRTTVSDVRKNFGSGGVLVSRTAPGEFTHLELDYIQKLLRGRSVPSRIEVSDTWQRAYLWVAPEKRGDLQHALDEYAKLVSSANVARPHPQPAAEPVQRLAT
jgi:serine/threonine protein phosphatase PrpC